MSLDEIVFGWMKPFLDDSEQGRRHPSDARTCSILPRPHNFLGTESCRNPHNGLSDGPLWFKGAIACAWSFRQVRLKVVLVCICYVSQCPVDGISCQVGWWQRSTIGPRPPPEKWPRAQQFRQLGSAQRQEKSPLQPPPLRQPSRVPEAVVKDAIGEIKSLEAAAAIELLFSKSVWIRAGSSSSGARSEVPTKSLPGLSSRKQVSKQKLPRRSNVS